jgi:putative ABC transport system permease protein
MVRHIIIAAWRNMMANRLISAIAIFGLSIGIAAALLMALVVRNQLSFDEFLPDQERTYVVTVGDSFAYFGGIPGVGTSTEARTAETLRLNIPQIESVTRLDHGGAKIRTGRTSANELVVWADPNMFTVLPFPVLYGDATTALGRPDGVVLPRLLAQKYFGSDNVVGEAIEIDGHPMTVRAVVRDIPANASRFDNAPYISGLAPFSSFAKRTVKGRITIGSQTYVRLKPGASVSDAEKPMPTLLDSLVRGTGKGAGLMHLDQAHFEIDNRPADKQRLAIGIAVALLTLFIAGANFVNMMVARSTQREREIGVRKACGAGRGSLAVQFLGEAMITTLLAALIALALSEWALPLANGYFQAGVTSDYWRDVLFMATLPAGIAILGMAAGAYPAMVLSAFRPAGILRNWSRAGHGSGIVRAALVMLQFAILVGLIVASDAVYRQYAFVAREALRVNIDQILAVSGGCNTPFRNGLRDIPGVKRFSCSGDEFVDGLMINNYPFRGKDVALAVARVDRDLFALYGQQPVAGTLTNPAPGGGAITRPGLVINMAAVRKLGFATAAAAIGQGIWQQGSFAGLKIVAVVPDFSLNNFDNKPILPAVFTSFDGGFQPASQNAMLHIRLDGRRIPETLAAIDRLWKTTGGEGATDRYFLDAHMQERYVSIFRQAQLFAIFAGIAMFLACLGLFGIAVSTTERRTKEIGVRKAMGAGDGQVVALLLWQFAQPVLWANVIAWPVAWWLMRRWLSGFAYHIDLHWWVFAAASLGALIIALVTVAGQAWLTARARPVLALRYE